MPKKTNSKCGPPSYGRVTEILLEERRTRNSHSARNRRLPKSDFFGLIAAQSEPADLALFEKLESAAVYDYEYGEKRENASAIVILFECAVYYENIGIPEKAIKAGLCALEWANTTNDVPLRRRLHSFIGATYTRLSDFSSACLNMQAAYELALQTGDEIAIFATLANTVAALESMGLLSDARDLALQVAIHQPWGNVKLDYIHLSNASNGLRISHVLEDIKSARIFYRVADKAIITASHFASEITKAHFEAARIVYLVAEGQHTLAEQLATKALLQRSAQQNIRVRALIVCAQAEVNLALGSIEKIAYSRVEAEQLLVLAKSLPDHYEDLLRTLVKLDAELGILLPKPQSSKAPCYLQLLKDHSLAVKHRNFFKSTPEIDNQEKMHQITFENPSYLLPSWICNLEISSLKGLVTVRSIDTHSNSVRKSIPFDVQQIKILDTEDHIRTAEFNIAENWAVATEFATGGNGRHYLQVGRIAAAIAKKIGYSSDDAIRIELACRLHDIGKVAIAFSPKESGASRAFGTFSLMCKHTVLGEFLLKSSEDEILQLAARVAKSHHEWWNGCGYPLGLQGELIPLEGRICAIADVFVSMLRLNSEPTPWTIDLSVRQMQTMAGIQLDPHLLLPLAQVIEEVDSYEELFMSLDKFGLQDSSSQKIRSISPKYLTM